MTKKLRVNVVSESAVSVQGHGVHTAYEEMCHALEKRNDVIVRRNEFSHRIDCDIIHFHTVGPRTWWKLLQKGPKKVISAHVVPDSFVGSLIGAKLWKPLAVVYLRWFYNRADLVLAVSDDAKQQLEKMHVRAKIEVLYNFIDTAMYHHASSPSAVVSLRKQLGIAKDSFVVIGAGQVQPRKRVDVFAIAAKNLPDVDFVWVGGMPFGRLAAEFDGMEKLMKTKLPNLHFPGIVDLKQMVDYYKAADAFMLPSEQETFGLVVVEAAASGLPVVLRDLPEYKATFAEDALLASTDDEFISLVTSLQNVIVYQRQKNKSQLISKRFDSENAASDLMARYHLLV